MAYLNTLNPTNSRTRLVPSNSSTTITRPAMTASRSRCQMSILSGPGGSTGTSILNPDGEFDNQSLYEPAKTSDERNKSAAFKILDAIERSDHLHPINWPAWKRWGIVIVYCCLQAFVTMTQTTYLSAEDEIMKKWGGSQQIVTLGQSLFLAGNALGPVVLGPLADISGRKWVYVFSIALYAVVNIGCFFAGNLPMLIIFMFVAGVVGSAALTNVAGTIADLFGDIDGAMQPMALFVCAANIGPSMGSPIGEIIVRYLGWQWIFMVNIIGGGAFAVGLCFMPETIARYAIARDGIRVDHITDWEAGTLTQKICVGGEMKFVARTARDLLFKEWSIICLGMMNGLAFGLMFLYLDGIFKVFVINKHLSDIQADLTYLNWVAGVIMMFFIVYIQTYLFKRDRVENNAGVNRPEARFLTSLVGVWLIPATLFWFAFTSDSKSSAWSPIIAGTILGIVDPLLWLAMLTYLTDAYPHIAASAIACFQLPSNILAGIFAHVGIVMFDKLSTTAAMAILAGASFAIVIMVYVFYFLGGRIRAASTRARPPLTVEQKAKVRRRRSQYRRF